MAFVPALYAWFNITGFWDPYSQTSHIRVAVANEDEGATKEQIGTVNVGAMLETQLKGNDQLGWHFVSADEARAEVERGDSYAAFVIPASFSRDLTGIVDGTYVKPNIQYYVNEKNNAVAPKITGAGATALDRQINSAFVSTVAKVLSEKASEAGVVSRTTLTRSVRTCPRRCPRPRPSLVAPRRPWTAWGTRSTRRRPRLPRRARP